MASSDFIFPVIGEEWGLIGTLILVVVFALIALRGFTIAYQTKDPFGALLAAGLTTLISVQALINMAVATSSIPNTGVPLPFISSGGSALVLMMAGIGLLLNISRSPTAPARRRARATRSRPPTRKTGTAAGSAGHFASRARARAGTTPSRPIRRADKRPHARQRAAMSGDHEPKREIRILVTGGGTGGHVTPALAVIQTVREMAQEAPTGGPGFCYVGSAQGVEATAGAGGRHRVRRRPERQTAPGEEPAPACSAAATWRTPCASPSASRRRWARCAASGPMSSWRPAATSPSRRWSPPGCSASRS